MFTGTRHRLILIALILLGVGVAALTWFLGVDPQFKALDRAQADTLQERQMNDLEQITVEKLRQQNEQIDEFRAELAKYREGIPEVHLQPELLRQLNGAASASGATLVTVTTGEILRYAAPEWQQPAPDVGNGRLVGLTIMLQARGTTEEVQNFVSRVQQLNRFITVSSVTMSVGEESSQVQISGTGWVLLAADAGGSAAGAEAVPADDGAAEEGSAEAAAQ